jgi:uncharacterized membrane protein
MSNDFNDARRRLPHERRLSSVVADPYVAGSLALVCVAAVLFIASQGWLTAAIAVVMTLAGFNIIASRVVR